MAFGIQSLTSLVSSGTDALSNLSIGTAGNVASARQIDFDNGILPVSLSQTLGSARDTLVDQDQSQITDPTGIEGAKSWIDYGNKNFSGRTYYLDLLRKYNKNSPMKQFHAVTIVLRGPQDQAVIAAALPEKLQYTIGSKWNVPFKSTNASTSFRSLIQEMTGNQYSLKWVYGNCLVWEDAEPLVMKLKIPGFDDGLDQTQVNYQDVMKLLGEAVLPEIGKSGQFSSLPGPSMMSVLDNTENIAGTGTADKVEKAFKEFKDSYSHQSKWPRITVQIGGLLLIDYCIIKNVSITCFTI